MVKIPVLWMFEKYTRARSLIDLEFPEVPTPLTQKVAKGIGEFETYIRNNEEFNPKLRRTLPKRRDDQHGLR